MASNAKKAECKSDRPGFSDLLKDLIGQISIPDLLPLPELPDISLPGIPKPKIEISLPKPSLPSPSEAFKLKMDGFKFQLDLLNSLSVPDFEPPAVPKIPTPDVVLDLALGIEIPDFPDLDINLDDITPDGFKRACIDIKHQGDDVKFVEGEEVKVSIKDPEGKEISIKKIKTDGEEKFCSLLLAEGVSFVTVAMTGLVEDSQGNRSQKTVEVTVNV